MLTSATLASKVASATLEIKTHRRPRLQLTRVGGFFGLPRGLDMLPKPGLLTVVAPAYLFKRKLVLGCSMIGNAANPPPTWEEYTTNLSALVAEGKLAPVIGREIEIERVFQILGCLTKNIPWLIREPHVHTAHIAEGVAHMFAKMKHDSGLSEVIILELQMSRVGEEPENYRNFKEKMDNLMSNIKNNEQVILFIDFAETSIKLLDAICILRPALVRGELQCIFACTADEYKTVIELFPKVGRHLSETVNVPEPTVDETVQILKGRLALFEKHHMVRYTEYSLVAAAELSDLYNKSNRSKHVKALDLIDLAGSRVARLHFKQVEKLCDEDKNKEMSKVESNGRDGGPVVTQLDIQYAISSLTGITVQKFTRGTMEETLPKLQQAFHKLEQTLHERTVGQDKAVDTIMTVLKSNEIKWFCGLKYPGEPITSIMFSGPAIVGKSEVAKCLANFYFGSEEAMIILYMPLDGESILKRIGSSPGFPGTVILFDSVEKAEPDAWNMILQLLKRGELTNSEGLTVKFKNTVIIMTSYVSFEDVDFIEEDRNYNIIQKLVLDKLDCIVVFGGLGKLAVSDINVMLKSISDRLQAKGIALQVTERFKDRVIDEGYNPSHGARAVSIAIRRLLLKSLAKKIISGEIKKGDTVVCDIGTDGEVIFHDGSRGNSSLPGHNGVGV